MVRDDQRFCCPDSNADADSNPNSDSYADANSNATERPWLLAGRF